MILVARNRQFFRNVIYGSLVETRLVLTKRGGMRNH